MFTGLVEAQGRIASMGRTDSGLHLVIEAPPRLTEDMATGDSLAVNGLCLTAVNIAAKSLAFDVVEESLRRSNLGGLHVGDSVNLERALQLGGRLGGHLVSGHIDCVGRVTDFQRGGECTLSLAIPEDWGRFLFAKGSLAVNGVSLTLATVQPVAGKERVCSLCLIPATLAATNLGALNVSDSVNIETDQIARYAVEALERIRPA